MTLVNKIAYFLIAFVVIFSALAYGAVHQPIIAVFYLLVTLMTALWSVDGLIGGSLTFSSSPLQLPIYARARNRQHAYALWDVGVTMLNRETLFSALNIDNQLAASAPALPLPA